MSQDFGKRLPLLKKDSKFVHNNECFILNMYDLYFDSSHHHLYST